jgi:hypothetical protein
MRFIFLAAGPVLVGCALVVVTSCSTDERETEAGLAPSMNPVAAAAVIPCIGVPSGDATAYEEKRVFLESQGWWGDRRADGTVPKRGAAEHIHVGMCFPVQQTISGTKTLRVRVMAHNLPVGSVIEQTSLHDPDGGSIPDITWNRTVLSSDNKTVELWGTVQVNTAFIPNGLREFRNLTSVRRPDGAEIHASSGWCWNISNTGGGTPVASGTCATTAKTTMARGWYDCFEYKIAEARNWDYPYAGLPRSTAYTLQIGARDGASAANNVFTSWEVRLDPDFHAGVNGSLIASGTGAANGQSVTIPASLMTAGVHRLVVIGSANARCTTAGPSGGSAPQDGEVSGVFNVAIKVN